MARLKIFSGRSNLALAQAVSAHLDQPLGNVSISNFPDGETSCKIEDDVRGRDVFIIQPTCPPVNDNLMELLIMLDSFKRASAARITAVIPYYGYARQDRKDEGRVPITAKLVANLITRAGADRVLTVDLHAYQIQGFFDIPVDHLYAAPLLSQHFLEMSSNRLVVVSPDEGSLKRCIGYARRLNAQLAVIDKRRVDATATKQAAILGAPVAGCTVLLFDDVISTGSSICGAAELVMRNGATAVWAAATHGILCGTAYNNLTASPLSGVVVTDTVPVQGRHKVHVATISKLLGDAITCIHTDASISALF